MALFITTYLSLFLTQILLTRAIDACVNATDSLRKEATPYPVLPPKPSTPYTKAFRQYRPSYHLTAPFNWLNDPCAPLYNGSHYHLYYQWNPYSYNWGNMTWGHVSSPDLVHWEDESIALKPDTSYDHLGVFTGSAISNGVNGEWTIFYTGVDFLPIGWRTPYNGTSAEHQALATSSDGGVTWKKYQGNPVIQDYPSYLNITGFRDPFIFRDENMSKMLKASARYTKLSMSQSNNTDDIVFATVSSGDRNGDRGGRLLLYASSNFTRWDYVGELFSTSGNATVPGTPASFGFNFEVANFFTFDNHTYYMTVGIEGGRREGVHDNHWSLWVAGTIRVDDEHGVKFVMQNAGVSDYGMYYAANSFHDPIKDRRIIFGWTNDEDETIRASQGWAGMITLPREIFEKKVSNVSAFSCDKIVNNGSIHIESRTEDGSACSVRTLGMRPIQETRALRKQSIRLISSKQITRSNRPIFEHLLPCDKIQNGTQLNQAVQWMPFSGTTYELMVEFDVNQLQESQKVGRFGVVIRATRDLQEYTLVYFDWATHQIGIDRSKSSASNSSLHVPPIDQGPFNLLKLMKMNGTQAVSQYETLRFHIYVDNSMIEVFVNERFAIAGRIYPNRPDEAIHAGYFVTIPTGNDSKVVYPIKASKVYSMKEIPFPGRPAESITPSLFRVGNGPFLGQSEQQCF